MNSTEHVSPAQLHKRTGPEEYDLVILGGGTGSTIAAWTFVASVAKPVDTKLTGISTGRGQSAADSRRVKEEVPFKKVG